MQLIVSRENLLKPLQQVCGVLSNRPNIPVLNNVLLHIQGNQLTITGTDLEVELSTTAQLDNETHGDVTIPAKKFLDICRSLPENAIINVDFEEDRAIIRSERTKFNLATFPAEEYPNLTDWQSEVDFIVSQANLRCLIDATQFSMANNDARYFLNGMKFETEGNLLRTVATDGHRLAVCTIELDQDLQNHAVILPRKGVLELARLLDTNSDVPARVQIGTNNLRVQLGSVIFTSKLIDGRFPDYRRVLPRNADRILEADWENLKQAFVRASILSSDKVRTVRLELADNQLKITARNPEQEEVEEIVDVHYTSEPMEIGFNVSYVLDVLNAIKSQRVRVRLTDASSSCLVEDVEDSGAEYVIMPMKL
ncbi:MAG: DNA polymerase III subunit beta [[Actinobacillus] rossii]|uniref:Beta sliding clamp n=1 Tax=[Actinobacillus] rossii TaxID=123820 RepID=A0A380TLZ0_9PAST|nr:DNA polymerase III subunit beta [[Actinobacillus] rossii]MDD7426472.1 DNA polymerase III subunit beta [[Actinobacillus] rossii]MDY3124840.1 DNA polymerase III subunit beta [[Actinobacillus] rossii]MDY4506559.1 DNA polymerase III subunit beta [[Actinobacillus] rossii]SUT87049.1 DNA polymerase III subunit beta [[Actinobacillus] rossii]